MKYGTRVEQHGNNLEEEEQKTLMARKAAARKQNSVVHAQIIGEVLQIRTGMLQEKRKENQNLWLRKRRPCIVTYLGRCL